MATSKLVLAYFRSSREEGGGIRSQEAVIEAFCANSGFEIAGKYRDTDYSRDSLSRPGLDALKDHMMLDSIIGIVATSNDRIGHDQVYREFLDLVVRDLNKTVFYAESGYKINQKTKPADLFRDRLMEDFSWLTHTETKVKQNRGRVVYLIRQHLTTIQNMGFEVEVDMPEALKKFLRPLNSMEVPLGGHSVKIQWKKAGTFKKKMTDLKRLASYKTALSLMARMLDCKDYRTVRNIMVDHRAELAKAGIDLDYYRVNEFAIKKNEQLKGKMRDLLKELEGYSFDE